MEPTVEELQKQIDEMTITIAALREQLRVMEEDRGPLIDTITQLRERIESAKLND